MRIGATTKAPQKPSLMVRLSKPKLNSPYGVFFDCNRSSRELSGLNATGFRPE
jgi:hypothetical protein